MLVTSLLNQTCISHYLLTFIFLNYFSKYLVPVNVICLSRWITSVNLLVLLQSSSTKVFKVNIVTVLIFKCLQIARGSFIKKEVREIARGNKIVLLQLSIVI